MRLAFGCSKRCARMRSSAWSGPPSTTRRTRVMRGSCSASPSGQRQNFLAPARRSGLLDSSAKTTTLRRPCAGPWRLGSSSRASGWRARCGASGGCTDTSAKACGCSTWYSTLHDVPQELLGSRAAVLNGAGVLAHVRGEYERAETLLSDSFGVARAVGSTSTMAASLHNLGALARERGDWTRAQRAYEESL